MTFVDFHTHRPTAEGVVTPRSFGIHPWHAAEETASCFQDFESKYEKPFDECQIVGECGLDKAVNVPWQRQMQLLEWQLAIAEKRGKPVVLHCVRSFNELLDLRKRYRSTPWVVHGFQGTLPLAMQLHRAGVGLSFGAALLDGRRQKVIETFRKLDVPFLVETDDSPCAIREIYAAAAAIRGTTIDTIALSVKQYYDSIFIFHEKSKYRRVGLCVESGK